MTTKRSTSVPAVLAFILACILAAVTATALYLTVNGAPADTASADDSAAPPMIAPSNGVDAVPAGSAGIFSQRQFLVLQSFVHKGLYYYYSPSLDEFTEQAYESGAGAAATSDIEVLHAQFADWCAEEDYSTSTCTVFPDTDLGRVFATVIAQDAESTTAQAIVWMSMADFDENGGHEHGTPRTSMLMTFTMSPAASEAGWEISAVTLERAYEE